MEIQKFHCQHHALRNQNACVSLVPIFNHLENEQMVEIMEVAQSALYKKGELIYHAGEPSNSLYIVNKGKIKIYRLSDSGKEQLVRMLIPGHFTGDFALFQDAQHESYAEAVEDTQVCFINKADLQKLLLKYPTISLKILTEFSNRLEQLEKQTTRFATKKVKSRIALFLAECVDNNLSNEFILPMNKKDLASYLGTTPETISRILKKFNDQGYIKQKPQRKIEIIDLDGLLLV